MAAAQRQKFPHGSMLYTQIYISIHMYMLHRKAKNSLVQCLSSIGIDCNSAICRWPSAVLLCDNLRYRECLINYVCLKEYTFVCMCLLTAANDNIVVSAAPQPVAYRLRPASFPFQCSNQIGFFSDAYLASRLQAHMLLLLFNATCMNKLLTSVRVRIMVIDMPTYIPSHKTLHILHMYACMYLNMCIYACVLSYHQ